jgi:hypothetical protein
MKSVYLVFHVRRDKWSEDVKLIGAYSTRVRAMAAIKRLTRRSGFDRYPDSFHIDRYELDRDHWVEGFG